MAGIIVVDRIESDASYASSINVASPLIIANSSTFTSDMTLTKATPYLYITSTGGTNQNIWMKDNANNTFAIESQPTAQGGVFLSNRTAAAPIYVRSANTGGTLVTSATLNQFGIGLGDSTPQSGMGIRFPASQNASSDANTLDDYEEGTFTPTLSGASTAGTTTYTIQQGSYTKIGRQVTISIRLSYSAATGTGEYRVGGFPFTVSNDSMEYIAPLITSNLNWGGGTYIQVYVIPNTTQATLFYCSDDGGWGVQQMVNESAEIRFTAIYFV